MVFACDEALLQILQDTGPWCVDGAWKWNSCLTSWSTGYVPTQNSTRSFSFPGLSRCSPPGDGVRSTGVHRELQIEPLLPLWWAETDEGVRDASWMYSNSGISSMSYRGEETPGQIQNKLQGGLYILSDLGTLWDVTAAAGERGWGGRRRTTDEVMTWTLMCTGKLGTIRYHKVACI